MRVGVLGHLGILRHGNTLRWPGTRNRHSPYFSKPKLTALLHRFSTTIELNWQMESQPMARLVTPFFLCSISEPTTHFQMRSGKAFGLWEVPHVSASNPAFDFEQLLQNAVEKETDGNFDSDSTASDDETTDQSDDDLTSPVEPTSTHVATPPIADLSAKDRRRIRKKSQSHSCRNKKRQKIGSFSRHEHSMRVHHKYIANCKPIVTPMSCENSGVARSAYIGLRDKKHAQTAHRLEDLVGPQSEFGFRLVEWDGRSTPPLPSFFEKD